MRNHSLEKNKNFKNKLIKNIKLISFTSRFQLQNQLKNFAIFVFALNFFLILSNFIFYILPPSRLPPSSQEFLQDYNFYLITIIGVSLYFGDLINGEFNNQTGMLIFPKLKRKIYFTGKFIGSYVYMVFTVISFYLVKGILSFHFYFEFPLLKILYSFLLTLLFLLASGGFVTLLSAFFNDGTKVIIFTLFLALFGFDILLPLFGIVFPYLEPFFSLNYLHQVVLLVFEGNLESTMENRFDPGSPTWWYNPTIPGGSIAMIIYFFVTFILALFISTKKEL